MNKMEELLDTPGNPLTLSSKIRRLDYAFYYIGSIKDELYNIYELRVLPSFSICGRIIRMLSVTFME